MPNAILCDSPFPAMLLPGREDQLAFRGNRNGNPSKFKIWGERCSGTNFMSSLVSANFPGLTSGMRTSWKHGLVKLHQTDTDLLHIFIVRDPLDWLRSLHRRPWHLPAKYWGEPFSEFIRREWFTDLHDRGRSGIEWWNDRHPTTRQRYRNILELRSVKLRYHLIALSMLPNTCLVRYEDVEHEPETLLNEIAGSFDLEHRQKFKAISTYKGHIAAKYTKRSYPDLEPNDVQFIFGELDADIESALSYGQPE